MHVKFSSCTAMPLFLPVARHDEEVARHQCRGVAVEGRVVTHRLIHASRLMREAASRLMRPRKGNTLKHVQHWAYKRPTWKRTTYSSSTVQPVH